MTEQEERDATMAGARLAVEVRSDPDIGIDEIEVTPDDRPARLGHAHADLAAAMQANDDYRQHIRYEADLDAEVTALTLAELRDRFAVAVCGEVYRVLYSISRGSPVQPEDVAREVWDIARVLAAGRPQS